MIHDIRVFYGSGTCSLEDENDYVFEYSSLFLDVNSNIFYVVPDSQYKFFMETQFNNHMLEIPSLDHLKSLL